MATSLVATTSASMSGCEPVALAIFSQRATWLRFPPRRPSSRSNAGSALGMGRRRRASTRPKASRIRPDKLTPASWARPTSRAFSAGVQRKTTDAPSAFWSHPPSPRGPPRSDGEGFEGEARRPSQGSVSYDTGRLALLFSPPAVIGHLGLVLGHQRTLAPAKHDAMCGVDHRLVLASGFGTRGSRAILASPKLPG